MAMLTQQLVAAEQLLREAGCLPRLQRIISECWRDNLARHDPQKGDDARTLGFTTAANISNRVLADQQLREVAETVAIEGWALIRASGFEIKVYKLPGLKATVSPNAADWSNSGAKEEGARQNTATVQLALFAMEAAIEASSVPHLRRLHLVHTADEETGEVVQYLGFPRLDDGEGPWFAVARLEDTAADERRLRDSGEPPAPSFDDQPVPGVVLKFRRSVEVVDQ
jgi:hypothetical protein